MYGADLNVYEWVCKSIKDDLRSKKTNELNWTLNEQRYFFMTMIGFKPVGVNRHFMMHLIHSKFSSSLDIDIPSKVLWDQLETLYDMSALNESEIIPFPNEESDYELSEECLELFKSKYGISLKTSNQGANRSSEASKLLKKLNPSKMKQNSPVSLSKANLSSPASSKTLKSPHIIKSENIIKAKQESASSIKTKDKRSSSPFSGMKQDGSEISSGKKMRPDRSISPSPLRKSIKNDNSTPTGVTRKTTRETTPVASRSTKEQTPDSLKKMKTDKESSLKKGKIVQSSEVTSTRKNPKPDIGIKKRSDSESSVKRSESSSLKPIRSEPKSASHPRNQESDLSPSSGSRKSSLMVKGKNIDSNKKAKASRSEEQQKKVTQGQKRRRIT